MCRVEHLVVVVPRPVLLLEERPRVVEEVDAEAAVVDVHGLGLGHQVVLSFDVVLQSVLDALQAPDARLDPLRVLLERLDAVVVEDVADVLEREVERPQPLDRAPCGSWLLLYER